MRTANLTLLETHTRPSPMKRFHCDILNCNSSQQENAAYSETTLECFVSGISFSPPARPAAHTHRPLALDVSKPKCMQPWNVPLNWTRSLRKTNFTFTARVAQRARLRFKRTETSWKQHVWPLAHSWPEHYCHSNSISQHHCSYSKRWSNKETDVIVFHKTQLCTIHLVHDA